MSAVRLGEKSEVQKPAVAARRRIVNYSSPSPSAAGKNEQSIVASKSTSDLTTPIKSKPARPDPPKFKPEVPPPPSFTKKPLVKNSKAAAVRKPSPPPQTSKQLLQSALSRYYANGYATTPSRGRKNKPNSRSSDNEGKSTNRDASNLGDAPMVYVNVAPKSPRPSSIKGHKAGNVVTGNVRASPPTLRAAEKRSWRPSPLRMVKVSDSRLNPCKSHIPPAKFSPVQKHLSPAEKQHLFATNSVPLPTSTIRQDFAKQPLPKGRARAQPVRPAPPRPHHLKKTSVERMGTVGERMKDKAIDEYTYVDPHKCRYEMSLEALDLSTSDRVIYANTQMDLSGYTALTNSTITEDSVYTVPKTEDSVYTVPDQQLFSPPLLEVGDLSHTGTEMDRFTDMEGNAGLYANVAPKPPVRSRSFTLNTSSVPDSPSPTIVQSSRSVGPSLPPPHEGKSPELADGNMYTAICYNTMETPSIYEVPPALK